MRGKCSLPWNDGLTGPALRVAATQAPRLRVRAGPGTGKTFAMMRRIARILEEGVPPVQVLVSTFTRVAAADLKAALVKLNVTGADKVVATTIHGLCFGILQKNTVLQRTGRSPRPLLEFETRFLLEDLKSDSFGDIPERRKRLRAYEGAWARLQTDQPGWPADSVDREFQEALLDWLRFHRAMLIGELVPVALRYLRDNPAAQELHDFKRVLVDEYQDLNAAEQGLIDLLAANAELTIVGDEDQSIYSFKFAHPDGIETFHQKHSGTVDESLSVCRRCPTWIVELAIELIGGRSSQSRRNLYPYSGNGRGEVKIVQWISTKAEAKGLTQFIQQRVANGAHPGSILVLATSRKFGYGIRNELNSSGIKALSFFREQALDGDPKKAGRFRQQEAMTLLELASNRTDAVALRSWCGFGSPSLRSAAWERIVDRSIQSGLSVSEVLDGICDGQINLPYVSQIRDRVVGLRQRLECLDGLTGQDLVDELFPDDAAFQDLRELAAEAPEDSVASTLLDTMRTGITQPELPTDVDYVRVMSLHKSKGLTADIVIVAGCVEGLLPRIDDKLSQGEQDAMLREQRRLFYVALTRTRQTLILSSVTRMTRRDAHSLGIEILEDGWFASTITSRFLDELGPSRPRPIMGTKLR